MQEHMGPTKPPTDGQTRIVFTNIRGNKGNGM